MDIRECKQPTEEYAGYLADMAYEQKHPQFMRHMREAARSPYLTTREREGIRRFIKGLAETF